MHRILLECCVDSVESALAAQRGGAQRLELCTALSAGGLSPTGTLFQAVRKHIDSQMKIHVLLRPRSGDFLYSDYEFEILREEVKLFRELGADGIVIGILKADGKLDEERLRELITLGGRMSKTLHRAFDMTADAHEALKMAIQLGFDTILTSGQSASAWEGRALLAELQKEAAGRIQIMPGAGISAEVLKKLYPVVPAEAFHMSGKKAVESRMQFRQPGVSMGTESTGEYQLFFTDENQVAGARKILDGFA